LPAAVSVIAAVRGGTEMAPERAVSAANNGSAALAEDAVAIVVLPWVVMLPEYYGSA
jgi:hypothetical protein